MSPLIVCCILKDNIVLVGIFSSLLATTLAYFFLLFWEYFKFHKLQGNYEGHRFQDNNPSLIKQEISSYAKIKYCCRNRLGITVKHDERCWSGMIYMHAENYGSVVWKYEPTNPNEFNFGYKSCYIRKEKNKIFICVTGTPFLDGVHIKHMTMNTDDLMKEFIKDKEIFIKCKKTYVSCK